jgi:prevent-host-death family protein
MASQINIYDAKTQLSRLVDRAAAGEEIVIARAGRPLAKLVPLTGGRALRRIGLCVGKIRIAPDFDDMPEDLQAAFEGGEE